ANLRSLGQALTVYVQQQGYYPLAIVEHSFAVWPGELWPLVGRSRDVFNCPARDERYWWTPQTSSVWFQEWPLVGDQPKFWVFGGSIPFSYGYHIGGADKPTAPRGW